MRGSGLRGNTFDLGPKALSTVVVCCRNPREVDKIHEGVDSHDSNTVSELPLGCTGSRVPSFGIAKPLLGARYRDYSFPSFAKGRHRRGRS